jgi:hypothetical protein
MVPTITTATALTSAGVTSNVPTVGAEDFVIQVLVANIGTNVVIRIEATLDETNWFNCDYDGDTTITANGTTAFNIPNAPLRAIRGRLVSISGGTPSVTFSFSRLGAGS